MLTNTLWLVYSSWVFHTYKRFPFDWTLSLIEKKNLFINIINLIIYHIFSAFFTAFSFQFLHSGGLSVWLLFPWKWSLILIILTDFLHFYIFLTSLDFLDFSTEHISANVPFSPQINEFISCLLCSCLFLSYAIHFESGNTKD